MPSSLPCKRLLPLDIEHLCNRVGNLVILASASHECVDRADGVSRHLGDVAIGKPPQLLLLGDLTAEKLVNFHHPLACVL